MSLKKVPGWYSNPDSVPGTMMVGFHCFLTVSYTHLDVYKRQPVDYVDMFAGVEVVEAQPVGGKVGLGAEVDSATLEHPRQN